MSSVTPVSRHGPRRCRALLHTGLGAPPAPALLPCGALVACAACGQCLRGLARVLRQDAAAGGRIASPGRDSLKLDVSLVNANIGPPQIPTDPVSGGNGGRSGRVVSQLSNGLRYRGMAPLAADRGRFCLPELTKNQLIPKACPRAPLRKGASPWKMTASSWSQNLLSMLRGRGASATSALISTP